MKLVELRIRGWQIIEKIGPILAIKSEDFNYQYVVEKTN